MIDAKGLLAALQGQQKKLEKDLREQVSALPVLKQALEEEYKAARAAERTAETFGSWRDEQVTQAAVAWLLACVFLRFCEDNRLIPEPLLAGPGDGSRQARERAREYFNRHPTENERHYLEHCFDQLAQYPAVAGLYDRRHNPLFRLPLSYDAAKALVDFWQRVDPDTGELAHDFTDQELNTRFLGDLYQDLSESARTRYALLQTPEFVEEFILERTLEPAIQTFGLETVRMIDPTCGSGHFLLGGFHRLLDHWAREAPGLDIRERVKRAIDAVYGVDINPFAVAIARFRLLLAALKVTGIRTLKEAPGWQFNVTAGDSLLHGRRFGELDLGGDALEQRFGHVYAAEDPAEIERILSQQYHTVVGNPPYINVKDKALNQLYRDRYRSCHRQYSLGVPFTERFFQLTLSATGQPAGYVGVITANSFTKREFGKKLIEEYLPKQDLTHVIDTSRAYIPGHGIPTIILLARHRRPVGGTVRAVLGIRGEPSAPKNPAQGLVWSSIIALMNRSGSEDNFVSVTDTKRELLGTHPWRMQGGSAPDTFAHIVNISSSRLNEHIIDIGFASFTGNDEVFLGCRQSLLRLGIPAGFVKPAILGDTVRDWKIDTTNSFAFAPYDGQFSLLELDTSSSWARYAWKYRTTLGGIVSFGKKTKRDLGEPWWGWYRWIQERYRNPLSITFGEVATHNHFVFDRGGKVFNRTAPVIKLPENVGEDLHLGLVGLLNSSTGCFWLKQSCFGKGGDHVGTEGARVVKNLWDERYAFNATRLLQFPILEQRPLTASVKLDRLACERGKVLPARLGEQILFSRGELDVARSKAASLMRQMIAWQEELDWWCYRAYGVCDKDLTCPGTPPEIELGERAFEILLARKMVAGETETTWFTRHGSKPITEIPDHWPADYCALVERRFRLIESNSWIELLERPEYKRRWNQPSWESLERDALKDWLLDRLETSSYWPEPQMRSVEELVALAERDRDWMAVAELYTEQTGFDVQALVTALLGESSVPALRVLRYKESGLRKRADWEATWELQRREDAIDAQVTAELTRREDEADEARQERLKKAQDKRKKAELGDIPVPPKYKSGDFLNSTLWRLRGALDVPKERFFSLPSGDPAGGWLYGWAGWNPAERVQALFGAYTEGAERKGWETAQLLPLLAAVDEELPWVLQWHNEVHPEFGVRLGDFFRERLGQELHHHGLTREDLTNWKPAATGRGRRRRTQA